MSFECVTAFIASLQHVGLISFFTVLIGWWVVYQNAKRLATRSETKGFVDELMKATSEMEKVAVEYWLAGRKERAEPRNYEMLMLAKLKQFDQKISLLKQREINTDGIVDISGVFQESILLDCESADHMSLDERIDRANNVLAYGGSLQTHLYTLFIEKYPPKL